MQGRARHGGRIRILTKAQHTLTAASWPNAAGCWPGPLGLLWVHEPIRGSGRFEEWDQSPLLPPGQRRWSIPSTEQHGKTNTQPNQHPGAISAEGN